jgi:IS1 family transposase/transposase-like protein
MSNLGPFSGTNIQGVAMTLIPVRCLHCESDQVVKRGMTCNGKQRYLCQNEECAHGSFLLEYSDRGRLPQVKQQVVDMALNGSGIRDTARVLKISKDTVLSELKAKEDVIEPVNQALLSRLNPDDITAVVQRVDEAEVDEMWSYVGNKDEQRWLWHAIDHATGVVLAYVFGRRKDEVFLALKHLLEPFGITRYYTDHLGAYQRHLEPDVHCPSKRYTQQIERKHLTLRTRIKRLARKTICFSKSAQMHDIVIGLFVNRYEFARPV